MNDSLLRTSIRASARRLLIINGLLVAAIIAIFAVSSRYYRNYFSGPYAMPRTELASLSNAKEPDRYYITIDGDQGLETGYQEVTRTVDRASGRVESEKVTANYHILVLGESLLMVKANEADARKTYVGALAEFPADLRSEFLSELRAENADLADQVDDALLPVMLDSTPFKTNGTIGLAIMLPLLALGGFNLFRGFRRLSDPLTHPLARTLAARGSFAEIESQIEAEVRNGVGVASVNKTVIAPSWLIVREGNTLAVLHRDDLVWAYQRVTQRRVYGIPAGKTFGIVIKARPNADLTIQASEYQVQQFIEHIAQRAPWILLGYSEQIEREWKKNRNALFAAVDQRRAQAMAKPMA